MASQAIPVNPKRLIVCCDGTWNNSDSGYVEPSLFNPVGEFQVPSNVTRIARSFRRVCQDGRIQVIEYQAGVGTGSTTLEVLTGGAFGEGIASNIREIYSFVCANFMDGDEIILIGFSRGAFTARSVASMISDLGLLTREGMEYFFPIFKDMQNWKTKNYKDSFPGIPFADKPRGEDAADVYREMLLKRGLTRVYQQNEQLIKVKAVGVWDTVGSLGIPDVAFLSRLGIKASRDEYRFYDTSLPERVEYAFQALALDEHRPPFSPSVWERTAANGGATALRQCWFAGDHCNIGGGWQDAGIANMSLAWMMDQLASVGVEFDEGTIPRIFSRLERYYRIDYAAEHGGPALPRLQPADPDMTELAKMKKNKRGLLSGLLEPFKREKLPWAVSAIYDPNVPIRPWALGAILFAPGLLNTLSGHIVRMPGMYKKVKPTTGAPTSAFLEDTNERIHSSVRVRLAAQGLGIDDRKLWDCPSLRGRWRLARRPADAFEDPIPPSVQTWEPPKLVKAALRDERKDMTGTQTGHTNDGAAGDNEVESGVRNPQKLLIDAAAQQRPLDSLMDKPDRWVWEYIGPEAEAPPERVMVEEPLGPYERQLLRLAGGTPNVYDYAEGIEVQF